MNIEVKRGNMIDSTPLEVGDHCLHVKCWIMMYKLNVLASARVVCNIMGVQVRGRSHRELCS
jgi:hypothetical protein